jgi:hypothetical protein
MVGAASGGGGRLLTARGGRMRRRGSRCVVEAVREGLERHSMMGMVGDGAVKW